eukprot:1867427-Rhodomonas_salina.1
MDGNGSVVGSPSAMYGGAITIVCNDGFRATTALLASVADMDEYNVTCQDTCTLVAFPATLRCRRLQCPELSIENSSFLHGTSLLAEDQTLRVTCNTGFQVRGSVAAFEVACDNSFWVQCLDGNISYSLDSVSWSYSSLSCERHCGQRDDVCGSESCSVVAPYNFVEHAEPPSDGVQYVMHGQLQTVTCLPGYREASVLDRFASCHASSSFTRDCQNCAFNSSRACRPFGCTWTPELEPNGLHSGNFSVAFQLKVQIQCNTGYRASDSPGPRSSALIDYNLTCVDSCDLISAPPGSGCEKVQCAPFTVPHGSTASNFSGPFHNSTETYTCLPGYRLQLNETHPFQSQFGVSCQNEFDVSCNDGLISFRAKGGSWSSEPPVCIRHCGDVGDVC